MVIAAALLAGLVVLGADPGPGPEPEAAAAPVRRALGEGQYPWYDAVADDVRPVKPPWRMDWDWIPESRASPKDTPASNGAGGGLNPGQIIVFALMALLLAAVLLGLAWAWRLRVPLPEELEREARRRGAAARVGALPAGLEEDLDDPWAEAGRRRARGDLAGAVVALFVDQITLLDRHGLSPLAPGRTARQLVRAVADGSVRGAVEPTLRLFEAVRYGHRDPTPEAFEAAWARAEALRGRLAEGGTP